MDKSRLQEIAAHQLYKDTRLICEWATGVGKSRVALQFLKEHPDFDCLIVVPEQNNIKNWEDEFRDAGVPLDNATIICYASLHKFAGSSWYLLVLDEVPHIDTQLKISILQTIRPSYVLALGAVIDEEEKASLESVYGTFHHERISLDDAISMGILPEPDIRILHLQLDNKNKRNWHYGKMYTDQEYYNILADRVSALHDKHEETHEPAIKGEMFAAGIKRKRLLGKLKDDGLQRACAKLKEKNKRFICFCSSIRQATMLGKENAFTSKSKASLHHVDRFNNHEIDSLYVVGKLIEGQNLRDIECGIIGQLGGTERITIQSIGRVMRSLKPIVFILMFDDTKDEEYLYSITSNIPEKYIKHYKF